MSEDNVYELRLGDAIFTFGDKCPQVKSLFFPNKNTKDEAEAEAEAVENKGEEDDPSQST